MLDVHVRHDINTRIQQNLDILPSLCARRTRHIGMRQFINHTDGRAPIQDGLVVHFLKSRRSVPAGLGGNHFESHSFRHRVFPSVWLKVANHDVSPLSLDLLSIFKHAVGLANASGITQIHVQPASGGMRAITTWAFASWGRRRHRSLPQTG